MKYEKVNSCIFVCLSLLLLTSCSNDVDHHRTMEAQSISMCNVAKKARMSSNYEAANNFFNKAIELNKTNSEAWFGLAEVKIDNKLLDAAEVYINKAIETGGNKDRALYLRGKIRLLLGNENAAQKFFQESNNIDSLNALGTIYDHRKEHKLAQQLYKKIINLDPTYIDAYNNLGLSLMLSDNYEKAIAYLENACSLPEASVMTRSNLALAYGLSGNIKKAQEIYEQDLTENEVKEKIAYIEELLSTKQNNFFR